MKTDDLITLLSTATEPVSPHTGARRIVRAMAWSLPASVVLMLAILGLNPELGAYAQLPMFWLKLLAPLGMAVTGLALLGPRLLRW